MLVLGGMVFLHPIPLAKVSCAMERRQQLVVCILDVDMWAKGWDGIAFCLIKGPNAQLTLVSVLVPCRVLGPETSRRKRRRRRSHVSFAVTHLFRGSWALRGWPWMPCWPLRQWWQLCVTSGSSSPSSCCSHRIRRRSW